MKKSLLLITLFFFSQSLVAQMDMALQKQLDGFMEATRAPNIDALLDHMYPQVFTFAAREDMKEAIEEIFENEEMIVTMDSLKTGKVYDAIHFEKDQYIKITYSFLMLMTFKRTEKIQNPEETAKLTAQILKGRYDQDNVLYDSLTSSIKIRTSSSMVAIKNKLSPEWTFLDLENNKSMLSVLLHETIIDKLAQLN